MAGAEGGERGNDRGKEKERERDLSFVILECIWELINSCDNHVT